MLKTSLEYRKLDLPDEAAGTVIRFHPSCWFAALPIPVACADEMQEVVRHIETAFAWLDRVAAEHANASRLMPKLDQAILARAFRGELILHDPYDKPVELSATPAAESYEMSLHHNLGS
jgi:hypothetical protein